MRLAGIGGVRGAGVGDLRPTVTAGRRGGSAALAADKRSAHLLHFNGILP
jgi:hypothetical protein